MSPAAMSHFAAVLPCAYALIRILFNLAPSGDVNSFRTPWGTVAGAPQPPNVQLFLSCSHSLCCYCAERALPQPPYPAPLKPSHESNHQYSITS